MRGLPKRERLRVSLVMSSFEIAMRLCRIAQCVSLVDCDLHAAALHEIEQLAATGLEVASLANEVP